MLCSQMQRRVTVLIAGIRRKPVFQQHPYQLQTILILAGKRIPPCCLLPTGIMQQGIHRSIHGVNIRSGLL